MLLLDTHVMLWLRLGLGEPRLGRRSRREIDQAWRSGELAVSAISFWEVALLKSKGRIRFPGDVALWREEQLGQGVVELPVDGETAVRSVLLEGLPSDPADRIIVATALAGHELVTADNRILGWRGGLSTLDARE